MLGECSPRPAGLRRGGSTSGDDARDSACEVARDVGRDDALDEALPRPGAGVARRPCLSIRVLLRLPVVLSEASVSAAEVSEGARVPRALRRRRCPFPYSTRLHFTFCSWQKSQTGYLRPPSCNCSFSGFVDNQQLPPLSTHRSQAGFCKSSQR